jgi:hypothetical protein
LLEANGEEAFARWAIGDTAKSFFQYPQLSDLTNSRLGAFVQTLYSELMPLNHKETTDQERYALMKRLQERLSNDRVFFGSVSDFFRVVKKIETEEVQGFTLAGAFVTQLIRNFPVQVSMINNLCEKLKYKGVPATIAGKCKLNAELARAVIDAYRPTVEWLRSLVRDLPNIEEFQTWLGAGAPTAAEQNPHVAPIEPTVQLQLLDPIQSLIDEMRAQPAVYRLTLDAWVVEDPVLLHSFRVAIENYRKVVQEYSHRRQPGVAGDGQDSQISAALAKMQQLLEQRFQTSLKKRKSN